MSLIQIDFETKSDVDIIKCGAAKYFAGKDADILFLSYKIDDGETKQWFTHQPLPAFMLNPKHHVFYAFNALFEYRAWNFIGAVKYGFGKIELNQMIDAMAICGRFAYPQRLSNVGDVLDLGIKKDERGKALIKKICCPPYDYTIAEFQEFKQYGLTDVYTMNDLREALPAYTLSPLEQQIWEMTQEINLRGIPIDIAAVKQILAVTEAYKIEQNKLLPSLTGGSVTRATQRQRIVNWLKRQGIPVPNLQAATVEKLLKRDDLSDSVRLVLTLRQELGKSSTAKYQKLVDQTHEGRIYDNLRYGGANTLRWAGMGFQLHNLPRSKVKDADPIIASFMDLSAIESDPINLAKSIIRGMIKAPKGKVLLAMDYSSIENRGLAWLANDEYTLNLFRKGLDQYIDMAAYFYDTPYDKVTEDERAFGKMVVLGCGYGLGANGLIENAKGWGINLSYSEAELAVNSYRQKYKKVVDLWYASKRAAINAISHPGRAFQVNSIAFKVVKDRNHNVWLQMTLPSGRAIYYNSPEIGDGEYGPEPTAMGINPYSKKWQRLKIIPGRFVENQCQATCRDILANGKLNLRAAGYPLIGSIHDEVILELEESWENDKTYKAVKSLLCKNPEWALDFPLEAEGAFMKRYRKI